MPTTRTTTESWRNQTDSQQQQQQQSGSQSGWQQLTAAPETSVESLLRALAMQVYQQSAGEAVAGYGVTPQSVMAGGVTDAQRQMVADWQNSTLAASRAGMQGMFDEQADMIANQMAARGVLGSSATGAAMGLMGRDLQRQYGSMAANAQAQAMQQLLGLSQGNQSMGMGLLQMQQQAREWAANPQILRDMMQYRIATGRTMSGSESSGSMNMSSTSQMDGYQKEVQKQQQPTDWGRILGQLGGMAALVAAPFTGGATLPGALGMFQAGASGAGGFSGYMPTGGMVDPSAAQNVPWR